MLPAIGLGWNLSKEDFLKDKLSWLNDLKLRASYGKTGNFNAGYYAYNQYYNTGSGYTFGASGTGGGVTGIEQGTLANPDLSYEKANKLNIGLDASVLSNKLSVSAEYYNNKYYDLLQIIGHNTAITGADYAQQNIGIQRFSGEEFSLNYKDHAGAFNYFISPNFSVLKTKSLYQDEPTRQYAYQQRTGLPVGQTFGYIASGLYQSVTEINNSAKPASLVLVPGDIRYVDQNGDNVIDENDQVAIGSTKPWVYYGLNLGGNYKGFDFSALLQGVENSNFYLSNEWAFLGTRGQAFESNLNRWTPQTAATATYPRLSIGTNANNQMTSSYWYRSGDYMRLKSVELGYTLPISVIKRVKLAGARIFINGTNLLTFTGLKDMDPEGSTSVYPIQKMFIAGVNVKF